MRINRRLIHKLLLSLLLGALTHDALGAVLPDWSSIFGSWGGDSCAAPVTSDYDEQSDDALKDDYTKLHGQSDDCGAFGVAYALAERSTAPSAVLTWSQNALSSALQAGDDSSVAQYGLQLAATQPAFQNSGPQLEEFRWTILQGVDGAISKMDSQTDSTWLEYGLNYETEKVAGASVPGARLLSFQAYLDDYGVSAPHAAEVQAMLARAVNKMVDRELGICAVLEKETEYLAVVTRLQGFVKVSVIASSSRAPEIYFHMIQNDLELADTIAHPPLIRVAYRWDDIRVEQDFKLPIGEPLDRNAVAQTLRANAAQALSALQQLNSKSPFVAQAAALMIQ